MAATRVERIETIQGPGLSSASPRACAPAPAEAESVFFNDPLIVVEDTKHSETEPHFNALGKTTQNRWLHVTFTLRQNATMIRVISARDMHRKERKAYEQA